MRKRPAIDRYVKRAEALGARDAKPIAVASIATGTWVRMKCRYGCGGYGRRLTCPPHSPEPEQTARMLGEYRDALLIHGDDHVDVTGVAVKVEREAFLDGYYKAFAMGSGPCRLCADCNVAEGDCRHPDAARPSMEACGIDVYQTARANGFPIEVVRNARDAQNYYSVVLLA